VAWDCVSHFLCYIWHKFWTVTRKWLSQGPQKIVKRNTLVLLRGFWCVITWCNEQKMYIDFQYGFTRTNISQITCNMYPILHCLQPITDELEWKIRRYKLWKLRSYPNVELMIPFEFIHQWNIVCLFVCLGECLKLKM
jgi:hypothetical protein